MTSTLPSWHEARTRRWTNRGYTDPSGAGFASPGFPAAGKRAPSNARCIDYAKPPTKIHVAIKSRQWRTAQRLLEEEPRRSGLMADQGMSLLHLAALHGAPADLVPLILQQNKEIVRLKCSGDGFTALHLACKHGLDTVALLAILDASPRLAAKRSKRRSGRKLPFHLLLEHMIKRSQRETPLRLAHSGVWDSLHGVLMAHRDAAAEKLWGLAPAEWARRLAAPRTLREHLWKYGEERNVLGAISAGLWDLSRKLVIASPRRAKARNEIREYALHAALCRDAPTPLVTELVVAYPGACERRSRISAELHAERSPVWYRRRAALVTAQDMLLNDRLPIHIAAERAYHADTFSVLLRASAASARQKLRGMTPLHIAVKHDCTCEVAQILVSAYPEALEERTKDDAQRTPLHAAAEHNVSIELLHYLVHACPSSVDQVDGVNLRPLHLALSNHGSMNAVCLLIAADGHKDGALTKLASSIFSDQRVYAQYSRTPSRQIHRQYWNVKQFCRLAAQRRARSSKETSKDCDSATPRSMHSEDSEDSEDSSSEDSSDDGNSYDDNEEDNEEEISEDAYDSLESHGESDGETKG